MEEFKVPQEQVAVEVMLRDGTRATGHMFVPVVGADGQPEPLADRLNGDERFMPFTRDGDFEMLHKPNLRWVRLLGPEPASDDEDDPSLERMLGLELDGGETVEGNVRYQMPHERCRLLDFLNVAPQFIVVIDDGARTLVNVDCVMRIRSLSPEPA